MIPNCIIAQGKRVRLGALLLLLAAGLLPTGCASMEESSNDQLETYHSTPETPGDDHGWGASVQGVNKQ